MVTAYTPSTSAQIEPISSTASTNTPKSPTSATLRLSSEDFIPQFDDDGNQTLIKTSTGVWQVMYNGENRPVMWACGATNILMKFNRMGRRVVKDDLRFIYDKYLQIANFEITASPICFTNDSPQRTIWGPTEPVATRPLVCNKANNSLFYIHDGNKNVREVISHDFQIETQFNYSPFGRSFAFNNANKLQNLWRFSCEYDDTDIGILYYNFRFYDLESGRWLSRDHIGEKGGIALYVTTFNNTISNFDVLGQRAKTETIVIGDISWSSVAHRYADFPSESFSNILNSDGDCIASLLIVVHGNCDNLGVNIIDASENIKTEDKRNSEISNLFKGVCFCKKCFIEFRSCYLGSSPLLRDRLIQNTGCRITLYPDPVDTDGIMRNPFEDKKMKKKKKNKTKNEKLEHIIRKLVVVAFRMPLDFRGILPRKQA